MKRILIAMLIVVALFVVGCSESAPEQTGESAPDTEVEEALGDFDAILEEARGTTVSFYGWGGDENRNAWLSGDVATYVKEHYDITLEPVGMNIEDILSKLSGEKAAGSEEGTIDMIWINGENFYSAKENGLLYGPFTEVLPNMEQYIDAEDPETNYDFGEPIEGYEAPYAKAQIVMYHDTANSSSFSSHEEFLELVKANPGKYTYPALPDFTGSAFVRNMIYDVVGWEQFQDMEANYDTVKEALEPALEYLRELNPHLWLEGTSFPESSTTLDQMFADGEVLMSMSYGPFSVAQGISNGTFSETTETFVLDKGTIGNTSYMAIAYNAPNKAGAMAVINAIISGELQLSQYENLRELPVVDVTKLSDEELNAFNAVEIGEGVLTQEELLTHRLPEMPARLVPIIEEIWLQEVVGKVNE